MTANRASAISVKRELLPVLWVQLKTVYSTSLVPLSFDQRKKAETNYLHTSAIDQLRHCNWFLCAHSACRQANGNLILIILTFFASNVLFMTKFYSQNLPLYTDSLLPKAVREKSSNP